MVNRSQKLWSMAHRQPYFGVSCYLHLSFLEQPSVTNTQSSINALSNIEVQRLDHLGLVAAAIDTLKLVERIDKRLPIPDNRDSHVTHGQRVKAMIINGLGYTTHPLYLSPKFFEGKDLTRLIGTGVEAVHLNDHALGRTLDALFAYGTTKLFAEIAFEVGQERGLLGQSVHIDTTTLLLHGEYSEAIALAQKKKKAEETLGITSTQAPTPALGYSKAHRHDLKQLVMSLTVTGEAAMPLWFESLSGNSSDKSNFHESIAKFEAFKQSIDSTASFLWVADSALYNKGKLQASQIKWLTRIPQTKTNAKQLVAQDNKDIAWQEIGNGYKGVIEDKIETDERWALLYSEQAYQREHITFERNINKALTKTQTELKQLANTVFACESDALKAAKKWQKTLKYHQVTFTVQPQARYSKAGKPAKGATPDLIDYRLSGIITDNEPAQNTQRNQLGRFILGTNITDDDSLTASAMLSTYIEQQDVERGFRFIKSDEFHLDGIYLHLPSRIDALMMVMTLSLMVYNVSEYEMRVALNKQGESLPSQKGKNTTRPTLRWVFQLMQDISILTMNDMPSHVSGIDETKEKIIRLFGQNACALYGVEM